MQADTAVIGNLGIKWKAGVKNELKKLARARLVHFPGESQIDIPGYTADIFLRVDSDAKVARSNNNEFARMKAITAQLEKDFKAKEEEICESDKRHRAEARQARTEKGLPITPSLGPGSFDDAGTESHHVDHPMAGPSNEASADADTDMPPPGEGVATLRREKISVQPTEWELVNDELDAVKLQNADLRAQLARVEADLFAKEAQLSESKAKEQALRDRMLVEAEYQEDLLRDLEHATEEVRRIGKERDDIQRKFDTIKQTMRSALEAAD
ncbi:hypothetical protein BV25DRAFT_1175064 [Artomyces pyxidatus]|uniref:Uncharacterized protein n=1 Tax=Artomyces pyxidatus TaxID=48021 RepID=A0ACB8SS84_9AGAM|nr:hypothetical protein BV25DRAFT_1175064 [Artomyces pyxidatus]